MEPEEWAEDDALWSPSPVPPTERTWRHPSEFGQFQAAPAGWAVGLHHPARKTAVTAGVVGLVCAFALLSLATGLHFTTPGPAVRAEQVVPPFFAVTTTVILESQQSDAVAWLGISTDDDKTVSAVSASSPAASAGVRRGDIIEAVDGAPVSSVDQVVRAIHRHHPGDVCVLTITRAKAHLTLRAVLGRLS